MHLSEEAFAFTQLVNPAPKFAGGIVKVPETELLELQENWCFSWNCGVVCVGRDFKDCLVSAPCHGCPKPPEHLQG